MANNLGVIPQNQIINFAATPPNSEPCLWHQETRIRRAISYALAALSATFGGIGYYATTHASVAALVLAPSLAAPIALTLSAVFLTAALANFIVLVKLYPSLNDPKERQKIRNQMNIDKLSAMPYGKIRALYPRKDVLTNAEINALLAKDVKNLSYDEFVQKHGKNEVFEILTQPHKDIIGRKFIKKIAGVIQDIKSAEEGFNLFKAELSFLGLDPLNDKSTFARKLSDTILESGLGVVQIHAQYAYILDPFQNTHSGIHLRKNVLYRDLNKLETQELSYTQFVEINGKFSFNFIELSKLSILKNAFCRLSVSEMLSNEYAEDHEFFFAGQKEDVQSQMQRLLEKKWTEFDLNSLPEGFMLAWEKGYVSLGVLSQLQQAVLSKGIIASARLNPQIFTDILNPKDSDQSIVNQLEREIEQFKDFNQLQAEVPLVLFQKGWLTKTSKVLSTLASQYILNYQLDRWLGLIHLPNVPSNLDQLMVTSKLMSDDVANRLEAWKAKISEFQNQSRQLKIFYVQRREAVRAQLNSTILSVQHQLKTADEALAKENAKLEKAFQQKSEIEAELQERTKEAENLETDALKKLEQQETETLEQLKKTFRESFEAEIRTIAPNFTWKDDYFEYILAL